MNGDGRVVSDRRTRAKNGRISVEDEVRKRWEEGGSYAGYVSFGWTLGHEKYLEFDMALRRV